ncbi:hypothetical protein KKHLCK_04630 [Candidatus Electrothrix laxa]
MRVEQYKAALVKAQAKIKPEYLQMLQAQYDLPEHKATATELAEYLRIPRWSQINLSYGRLGHILSDALNILPSISEERGKYQWWEIIAHGQNSSKGFVWTLRNAFVQALEEMHMLKKDYPPKNYWWFGVNNTKKRSEKAKPHVIYPEIEPLLSGRSEVFVWPYGGKPLRHYQKMAVGDAVIFWTGAGNHTQSWGIIGTGYISKIQQDENNRNMRFSLKMRYIPAVPLTPYPFKNPQRTGETDFLHRTFNDDFRPLQKLFFKLEYIAKPNSVATTIEEVTSEQYEAVLSYLQSSVKKVSDLDSGDNKSLRGELSLHRKPVKENTPQSQKHKWHICFGSPEPHMSQLLVLAEDNDKTTWTINRHARKNDRILFYLTSPVSSFVATGKVTTDAWLEQNEEDAWHDHYMADAEEVSMLTQTLSLKNLRKKIPEWKFLKAPRRSIVVPPTILPSLIKIVREFSKIQQDVNFPDRTPPVLVSNENFHIFNDIETTLQGLPLDTTEKERLQMTRVGQQRFRKDLITYWNGRCAVTGLQNIQILRASHIKPWRSCDNFERLDPFNGLLLTPNLDAAFDQGFITFNLQGKIKIVENFKQEGQQLGITETMKISLHKRHEIYLRYHRTHRLVNKKCI